MGTNYYHRTNICPHCNRYDEHHIGKSSAGWTFSFRGYHDYDELEIKSYAEWLSILESGGVIYNEYGKEVTLDDFKALIEAKRNAPNNHAACGYSGHDTIDDEGNSFTFCEFF